jgi:uncharacterized protein YcbK (DUF882 family)
MRSRAALVALALVALAAGSAVALARRSAPVSAPPPVAFVERCLPPVPPPSVALATAFSRLPALRVFRAEPAFSAEVRLYDARGYVDEGAASRLDELFSDVRDPLQPALARIDRRTLQLVFRAAYHFGATSVEVISGYRKPGRRREGLHGQGLAVDFRVQGVSAAELASYLRNLSRIGVGVYTHPRTQYVHVDVREASYHWLDASPPRRNWRERSLGRIAPAHDAAYRREQDWPEGLSPPEP